MSDTDVITAKAQRWALLVTEHRATFAEIAAIARRFPRDIILGELARQAASFSAKLEKDAIAPQFSSQPYGFGDLGKWGQNGYAPRIRSLASSARYRAEVLAASVKVAA